MSISSLALMAKKVIEAAWLNGDAYDLATQAAEALESAQLLQSPETAAKADGLTRLLVPAQVLRAEADDMPVGPSVFRAEEDGITLHHYTDREQARAHCLHKAKNDPLVTLPLTRPVQSWRWVVLGDDPDDPYETEELYATVHGQEAPTGYTVVPITLADRFDPEAEEGEDE
ncbi:hypothetical protein ACQEVY_23285 [Streptomyces sp. CA-288835]|uniref:hypothetical protein n=1 Tax=Streptomyces sp. CA-288835 TaxID=3240069 RepID=UPI003D8CFDEB